MATVAATHAMPSFVLDERDGDAEATHVLHAANALLATIGFGARQFERFEDLVASASSMSVALYEKLFQLRLERVVRIPRSLADYEANAQLVIDALASALLEHSDSESRLTGAALCAGDPHSIARVVRMFEKVLSILADAGGVPPAAVAATLQPPPAPAAGAHKRTKRRSTTAATTTRRSAAARVRPLRRPSSDSDSSDSSRDDAAPTLLPSRRSQRVLERPLRTTDEVNLYETSDASITRSRSSALPSRSRRAHPLTAASKPTPRVVNSDAVAAKRVRQLSRSPVESTDARSGDVSALPHHDQQQQRHRRRPESKKPRAHATARSQSRDARHATTATTTANNNNNSNSNSQRRTHSSNLNLRTTQRYGRFVPIATMRRSDEQSDASASDQALDMHVQRQRRRGRRSALNDSVKPQSVTRNEEEEENTLERMYFGGVSSVSNGSRTDNSVHFIDDVDASIGTRDFSMSRVVGVDLQHMQQRPQSTNVQSPTNAYDDDNSVDMHSVTTHGRPQEPVRRHDQQQQQQQRRNRSTSRSHNVLSTNVNDNVDVASNLQTSRNQEDGEPVDVVDTNDKENETDNVASNDRVLRRELPRDATSADDEQHEKLRRSRHHESVDTSSLYPLLPTMSKTSTGATATTAATKAHTEFQRYKLVLKDHLQALRQREVCQRQHMERAFKGSEHTAHVERIRARRFQQDIRMQRVAIGLETRSEEEKHLRETLAHILSLEKAKLRDEHQATTSVVQQIQHEHAQRERALETFYANQIELVKEQTHRKVHERALVEKAHRLASAQMIRELRREREHDVAALLRETQHLDEARRFRTASQLANVRERSSNDARAAAAKIHTRADAFYTAAMRARALQGRGVGGTLTGARTHAGNVRMKTKTRPTAVQSTRIAYNSVRPAPAQRRRGT